MLCVSVLFILGVLLNNWFSPNRNLIFYLTLCLLFILIICPRHKLGYQTRSQILPLLIILSGILHSSYQRKYQLVQSEYINSISKNSTFLAEISSCSQTDKFINLTVLLFATVTHEHHQRTPIIKGLVKIKKESQTAHFQPGDHIEVAVDFISTFQNSKNPINTYYSRLYQQGILQVAYVNSDQIRSANTNYNFRKIIRYSIRNQALKFLDGQIKNRQSVAITKALLLGFKNDIDSATNKSFSESGTMHILAVSGLHVGIIAFILFQIVDRVIFLLPKYSVYKITIIIGGLIFFAEISGGAPPVWRAVLVTSLYLLGRSLSFQANSLNLIGSAGFILLLINHNSIFNLSFQLSFSAVIGIILIYPILETIYTPKGKIQEYIFGIVYMGVAAQIAIIPLALLYFNQLSLLSPLTSIISISSAFILIYLGVLLFTTAWIHPLIADFYCQLIEILSNLMIQTSQFMASVKIGSISNIYITSLEAWLTGVAILVLTIAFYKKSFNLTRVSLFIIAFQGFLHTAESIQHTNCFEVILEKKTQSVEEIYIGREAFVINQKSKNKHEINKKRKHHRINKVTLIDQLDEKNTTINL